VGALEPAAATAASLLARGNLAGGKTPSVPGLIALVDERLAYHPRLRHALQEARAQPEDPARVGVLAQALMTLGEADPVFGRKLAELINHAQQALWIGGIVTQVYGHAQVGKLVTIGQAGDIHVHLPAAPPPTVLDRLPATQRGPLVSNLPPRNPHFIGREVLLERLHASLHQDQTTAVAQSHALALHGLGGVGKTQLALEYAYRQAADYDLIWWIPAEQPATIPTRLAELGQRLGLPASGDQTRTVAAVLDALRARDRWLLVFDNAEHPDDLADVWPADSGGHVLVTSRATDWDALAPLVQVDVMDREEAVPFVYRRSGSTDQAAAAQLAEELGGLPLALEQASAYVRQTGMSLASYVALVHDRPKDVLVRGRPAFYPRPLLSVEEATLATVWQASLHQAQIESAAAPDLLAACAFMAPEGIPRELVEGLRSEIEAAGGDAIVINDAIGALARYSLVGLDRQENTLSVHRLVQMLTRLTLTAELARHWAAVVLGLVNAAFPQDVAVRTSWLGCQRLLAHAIATAKHAEQLDIEPHTGAALLDRTLNYLRGRGQLAQAAGVIAWALPVSDATDERDEARAIVLRAGAIALRELGDLRGGRQALERALAIDLVVFGQDDWAVAEDLRELGQTLRDLGDLGASRRALERALAIDEAVFGGNHQQVATVLRQLAQTLGAQGDLGGSRRALERALAIDEAVFGGEHQTVAEDLYQLGWTLRELGNLDGSRLTMERALAIDEAVFGADHRRVAADLRQLSQTLRAQGDLGASRRLLERALAIDQALFGKDHRRVAANLHQLGWTLRELGDLAGSREALERALAIDRAVFGKDHRTVAEDLHQLGWTLRELGDLAGSREALERALAIDRAVFGKDHWRVAEDLHQLGQTLRAQGDLSGTRRGGGEVPGPRPGRGRSDSPSTQGDRESLGQATQNAGDPFTEGQESN
jgi:tetratricopeptide (TPR) repeat protein